MCSASHLPSLLAVSPRIGVQGYHQRLIQMYFIPLQFLQWILSLILSNIGISVMLMYLKILEQKTLNFIFLCQLFRIYLSNYFHFISRPRIIQSFPHRWSSFHPNCQGRRSSWSEQKRAHSVGRLFPLCCRAGIQHLEVLSSWIVESEIFHY